MKNAPSVAATGGAGLCRISGENSSRVHTQAIIETSGAAHLARHTRSNHGAAAVSVGKRNRARRTTVTLHAPRRGTSRLMKSPFLLGEPSERGHHGAATGHILSRHTSCATASHPHSQQATSSAAGFIASPQGQQARSRRNNDFSAHPVN